MSAAQNFKPRSLNSDQKGQGIIEIVVVVGLSALIILALVVLSVRSNTNATASSAADQAARFAQQGLEVIRSSRVITGSTTKLFYPLATSPVVSWQDFYSNLPGGGPSYDINPELAGTNGRSGHIDDPTTCSSLGFWCVVFDNVAGGKPVESNTRFTRTIYVADTSQADGGSSQCNNKLPNPPDFTDVKQFTVKVTWTDSAGPHNSTATSCITRTDSSTSS